MAPNLIYLSLKSTFCKVNSYFIYNCVEMGSNNGFHYLESFKLLKESMKSNYLTVFRLYDTRPLGHRCRNDIFSFILRK